MGAEIVGASFDRPADNKSFAEARRLPLRLLSDTDRRVGEAYEVLRDPADRARGGALRITYLIDPEGTIRESFQVQEIDGHPEEVLTALRSLQGVGAGEAR